MSEPASKRAKPGGLSDRIAQAEQHMRENPISALHQPAALAQHEAPKGEPVDAAIYSFLTQVRRGIKGAMTDEQRAAVDSGRAALEVEARLGLIMVRGGHIRAEPTIPGSGAVSRDAQEMGVAGYAFIPGVSPPTFNAVRAGAASLYASPPPPPPGAPPPDPVAVAAALAAAATRVPEAHSSDTVYTYADGARVVFADPPASGGGSGGGGGGSGGGARREIKDQKMNMNYQLPAAAYDFRVMVSVEDAQPLEAGASAASPPPGWASRRRRRRTTWAAPRPAAGAAPGRLWRLDVSVVDVTERRGDGEDDGFEDSEVLEVELEMQPDVQQQWLSETSEERAVVMTQHLAHDLFALIRGLNPLEPFSMITDPPREGRLQVAAAARRQLEALRRAGRGGSASGGGGMDGFPGAMPINMCRADVPLVQGGDYFISEKTDGVRYLLVVTAVEPGGDEPPPPPTCVLVDRKMNVFAVEGGEALADVFGVGTVLDGELVNRRVTAPAAAAANGDGEGGGAVQEEVTFMVFDMLSLRGAPVMGHRFRDRMQAVANHVTAAYGAARAEGGALAGVPHLKYVQKRFFKRTQVGDLLKCVIKAPGASRERLYHNAQDGRTHKTDGVIFQPDAPYEVGTHRALLKWKWLDVASVDLRVTVSEGTLRLSTESTGGAALDLTSVVKLSEHDRARLAADLRRDRSAIAEIAHDHATGVWVHMGLRADKDRPNFVTTVMSTLVELAEGMGEDELVYRMAAADAGADEWDKHARKMGRQLREWQLESQRKRAAAEAARRKS